MSTMIVLCGGCGKKFKGVPCGKKFKCTSCSNLYTFPPQEMTPELGRIFCSCCWRQVDQAPDLSACPSCNQRIQTKIGGRAVFVASVSSAGLKSTTTAPPKAASSDLRTPPLIAKPNPMATASARPTISRNQADSSKPVTKQGGSGLMGVLADAGATTYKVSSREVELEARLQQEASLTKQFYGDLQAAQKALRNQGGLAAQYAELQEKSSQSSAELTQLKQKLKDFEASGPGQSRADALKAQECEKARVKGLESQLSEARKSAEAAQENAAKERARTSVIEQSLDAERQARTAAEQARDQEAKTRANLEVQAVERQHELADAQTAANKSICTENELTRLRDLEERFNNELKTGENFRLEWSKLSQKHKALNAQYEEVREQLQAGHKTRDEAVEVRYKQEAKTRELEKDLADLQVGHDEERAQREDMQAALDKAIEERKAAEKLVVEHGAALLDQTAKLEASLAEQERKVQESSLLEARKAELEKHRDSKRSAAFAALESRIAALEQELSEAQTTRAAAVAEKSNFYEVRTASVAKAAERVQAPEVELEHARKEIERLTQFRAALEEQIVELRKVTPPGTPVQTAVLEGDAATQLEQARAEALQATAALDTLKDILYKALAPIPGQTREIMSALSNNARELAAFTSRTRHALEAAGTHRERLNAAIEDFIKLEGAVFSHHTQTGEAAQALADTISAVVGTPPQDDSAVSSGKAVAVDAAEEATPAAEADAAAFGEACKDPTELEVTPAPADSGALAEPEQPLSAEVLSQAAQNSPIGAFGVRRSAFQPNSELAQKAAATREQIAASDAQPEPEEAESAEAGKPKSSFLGRLFGGKKK